MERVRSRKKMTCLLYAFSTRCFWGSTGSIILLSTYRLLLESEVQKFQEEMSKLKPVIDKIENDFPEETYFRKNLKQRLDLEAVYVARKMKLGKDNQTDPRE